MPGSVWITANAGSGKTTFLTRRVVTLLVAGVAPERICCITYTKAAAGEMRARILGLLRGLVLANDTERFARLEALLGRVPEEKEMHRAQHLFGQVLDSVGGGLQLTTIHGFCQSILRRFPLEAGIAPHFTVLEDEAASTLLTRAKHRLLSRYQTGDTTLDAAFALIGIRSSESRFDEYVGSIIQKRGTWERIWRGQTPDTLRAAMLALHGLPAEANEASLYQQLYRAMGETDADLVRRHLPQLASHRNKGERHAAALLAEWLDTPEEARAPLLDAFLSLFLTQKGELRKQLLAKEFDNSPLALCMQRIAGGIVRLTGQLAALACAEESLAVALLARALLMQYAHAKTLMHALDYDDLIGKTCELFANPAMLGWVMSKLDHRIDHLLIDEAQDTSSEQWRMARLLVEELIAANEGMGSGDVPRSVLVVGDEKQSIYSFQGAAPELFATMKTQFDAMLSGSPSPLAEEMLTTSYRSAEAVLRVVDTIAAMPEIAVALNAQGIIHPHRLVRAEAAGRVTLYPAIAASESESLPPLTMPKTYQLTQPSTQQLATEVAHTVATWLREKRLLESEGRAVEPGDLLILVRTRGTLVLSLIRAFERLHVPVAGLDRLTLAEHLAVRDILALIRWVLNISDDLALAHALRSPIFGMSDEALRDWCVPRTGSLWQQLQTSPYAARLEKIRARQTHTPYEFLTELLDVDAARSRFAERFGDEVQEVLDELKNQAAMLPADMQPTLGYFHDWLNGSTRQIKREQESGEAGLVRIMTVHGAKGLEAPVVLLVDTALPKAKDEKIYFADTHHGQPVPLIALSEEAKTAPHLIAARQQRKDQALAEYYRLFYVALTRARDELHLWGIGNKNGDMPETSWHGIAARALRQLGAAEQNGRYSLRDQRPAAVAASPSQPITVPAAAPDWTTQPAPFMPSALRAFSPSRLVPEVTVSAYAQSGAEEAKTRGVILHRVLELLQHPSDLGTIARLMALVAPEWEETQRHAAAEEIETLMRAEPWIWQAPSHSEVTVSGTVAMGAARIPLSGQIDRLVLTRDAAIILDYKTNRQYPAHADEISKNYRVQLKAYRALVQQIYPEMTVRCALMWTSAPLLMWCDDVVATTPWPNQFVMDQGSLVA